MIVKGSHKFWKELEQAGNINLFVQCQGADDGEAKPKKKTKKSKKSLGTDGELTGKEKKKSKSAKVTPKPVDLLEQFLADDGDGGVTQDYETL